jgi:amidase
MGTQQVVSRSVRDSAAALDATAGALPGDPYWAPPPPHSYLAEVSAEPGRLRIGLILHAPADTAIDPVCRAAAEATARRCEALGHDVFPVVWPFPPEDLALAKATIVPAQTALAVAARLRELDRPLGANDLEAVTAMVVAWGNSGTSMEYATAMHAVHRVGRCMGRLLETVDAVLTPTLGRPPFPLGTLDTSKTTQFLTEVAPVTAFTAVANISGQPAMSIPLDHPPGHGPIGSQFIGRFGDEATLLRLAGQLERAHPWFNRIPPLPAEPATS